jgi:enoyl-CoA hydratase/carnithine racemase
VTTATDRQFIRLEIERRVAIITVDHPPVNTINGVALSELHGALEELANDDDVGAIILTGTGKSFVGGLDVPEVYEVLANGDPAQHPLWHGHLVTSRIESFPKPFVAAINGLCLGVGMELAVACHLRIASERAGFQHPEIDLGLMPGFGGTQRLPRLIGPAHALDMLLTGEPVTAHEAYRIGLVNRVVPPAVLLGEARTLAERLARRPAQAMQNIMRAVREAQSLDLAKGLELENQLYLETSRTENAREGVQAFVERRAPRFK